MKEKRISSQVMGAIAGITATRLRKAQPAPPPEEAETIEYETIEGALTAVARWRGYMFAHGVPFGFTSWSEAEQQSHLKRFVIPWLKTKITAAKAAVAGGEQEPRTEFREMSPKFLKAEEKRRRKAEKKLSLVT